MRDRGIVGLQPLGAIEGGESGFVFAEHAQATGEVDLGADFLGQELGGALQRLARLGEAAELQSRLAQQMQRLARNWAAPRRPGRAAARRREVAGRGALHGVAGQRLKLEIGKRHAPRLASGAARGQRKSRRSTGRLRSRPPASVRRGKGPGRVRIRPGSGFGMTAQPTRQKGLLASNWMLARAQAEVAQGAMVELGELAGARGRGGARC